MSKILFDLLCISFIIVVITDISDWPSTVKKSISYILTKGKITKTEYSLHLVDCSFCQTWWAGIIYLICTSEFTFINLAIVCALAALTMETKNLILLVKDLISTIYKIIYKLIIDKL